MNWRTALHIFIILNFLTGMLYAGYMVMFVVGDGGGLPLFGAAKEMAFETLATRRLYAIEFWLIFTGFALYLTLTGVLPGKKKDD